MRHFNDGDTIVIEPWRSRAFPLIKDLVVDRSAFDRVIRAGGYITVRTGSAPDAHAIPVDKEEADVAMDAAQCIGCGACVAAGPNGSARLFGDQRRAHREDEPRTPARRAQTRGELTGPAGPVASSSRESTG